MKISETTWLLFMETAELKPELIYDLQQNGIMDTLIIFSQPTLNKIFYSYQALLCAEIMCDKLFLLRHAMIVEIIFV